MYPSCFNDSSFVLCVCSWRIVVYSDALSGTRHLFAVFSAMSPMRITHPTRPRPIKSGFVSIVAWIDGGFQGEGDEGERVTSALPGDLIT